jgi:putative phosphoribosyl transferase
MRELAEIERRRRAYLRNRPRVPLDGRTLILVDDGMATGASVRAAPRGRRPHPRADETASPDSWSPASPTLTPAQVRLVPQLPSGRTRSRKLIGRR